MADWKNIGAMALGGAAPLVAHGAYKAAQAKADPQYGEATGFFGGFNPLKAQKAALKEDYRRMQEGELFDYGEFERQKAEASRAAGQQAQSIAEQQMRAQMGSPGMAGRQTEQIAALGEAAAEAGALAAGQAYETGLAKEAQEAARIQANMAAEAERRRQRNYTIAMTALSAVGGTAKHLLAGPFGDALGQSLASSLTTPMPAVEPTATPTVIEVPHTVDTPHSAVIGG